MTAATVVRVPVGARQRGDIFDGHEPIELRAGDDRDRAETQFADLVGEELGDRGVRWDGRGVGAQRGRHGQVEAMLDHWFARVVLVCRDRPPSHEQLARCGGDQPRNDETGASGGFGDEHDRGEWHSVAGTEKRGNAQQGEQRRVLR